MYDIKFYKRTAPFAFDIFKPCDHCLRIYPLINIYFFSNRFVCLIDEVFAYNPYL